MEIQRYLGDFAEILSCATRNTTLTVDFLAPYPLLDRGTGQGFGVDVVWFMLGSLGMEEMEPNLLRKRLRLIGDIFRRTTEEAFTLCQRCRTLHDLTNEEAQKYILLYKGLKKVLPDFIKNPHLRSFWDSKPELKGTDPSTLNKVDASFYNEFQFHARWSKIEVVTKKPLSFARFNKKRAQNFFTSYFEELALIHFTIPQKEGLAKTWTKFTPELFRFLEITELPKKNFSLGCLSLWGARPFFSSLKKSHLKVLEELKEGKVIIFQKGTYTLLESAKEPAPERGEIPLSETDELSLLYYGEPYRLWEDFALASLNKEFIPCTYLEEHPSFPVYLTKKTTPLKGLPKENIINCINNLISLEYTFCTFEERRAELEDFYVDVDNNFHLRKPLKKGLYDIQAIEELVYKLVGRDFQKYISFFNSTLLCQHPLILYDIGYMDHEIIFHAIDPLEQNFYSHDARLRFFESYESQVTAIFQTVYARVIQEVEIRTMNFFTLFRIAFFKYSRGSIMVDHIEEKITKEILKAAKEAE